MDHDNSLETKVLHLDITVKEDSIENGALEILTVIRPAWPVDDIKFKLLTDGITNKLVACKLNGADDDETVLVRVYGNKTDLLIDREAETRNILLLNRAGLVPDLYASFNNGLAYKFIPGCTLNSESVSNPDIYRLIATRMALLHKIKVAHVNNPQPVIWDKLRKFLDLVPDTFTDPDKHERYMKLVTPKSKIEEESEELRHLLEPLNSPIVFAHNDLLLGNVIYTEKENSVCFIDYEYAAFNYQAFDIGNHFAEFAGIDEIDYSRYPTKSLQTDWLKTYLRGYNGTEPSEDEVDKLYVKVNKFALLSHVFWGVWALIQAEYSYIDFDYISYAAVRFNEYFAKKDLFLSLQLQS